MKYKRILPVNLFVLMFLGISFFLVNVVGNKFLQGVGVDFTDNNMYTISPASQKILLELPEPINLRLYFSKKLANSYPYLINYASRVEELLKEYKKKGGSKISLEMIELGPFSGMEQQAFQDGILGIPIDGTTEELFFGIVARNGNNKEIIPFVEPNKESELEHDISSLIYKVSGLERFGINSELNNIRKREEYSRPLVKLKELQLYAEAKYQVRADALNNKLEQLRERLIDIKIRKEDAFYEQRQQLDREEELVKLEIIVTQVEVDEVKKELNKDITDLEKNIKLISIGIIPLIAIFIGAMVWLNQKKTYDEQIRTLS